MNVETNIFVSLHASQFIINILDRYYGLISICITKITNNKPQMNVSPLSDNICSEILVSFGCFRNGPYVFIPAGMFCYTTYSTIVITIEL